ncbi:MAG: hypothetical protein CM15mV37_0590 [uncultured marine virus]|nr:MAG: hypothetical protein CM15mV37_0590 [uncultured marine virus]
MREYLLNLKKLSSKKGKNKFSYKFNFVEWFQSEVVYEKSSAFGKNTLQKNQRKIEFKFHLYASYVLL